MSRLLALLVLGTAMGLGVWLGSSVALGGGQTSAQTFVVRPGDRIRVLDVPIACRVVRVRELGSRLALDCRRGGPLVGTYGTLLTAREAALVDFVSARSAKILTVAQHEGDVRRCERTP